MTSEPVGQRREHRFVHCADAGFAAVKGHLPHGTPARLEGGRIEQCGESPGTDISMGGEEKAWKDVTG